MEAADSKFFAAIIQKSEHCINCILKKEFAVVLRRKGHHGELFSTQVIQEVIHS